MVCPSCGAEAAADARFCASCGRALRGLDDERRVVTVLFADIVGFTSLSERLDPERVKILVDRCTELLAAEVHAYGGRVDKIVGDAVIALFGAPVAHEDDAERAVRAGLRLHEVLRAEAAQLGHDLRLRIGINTGEVLVGAMRAAGSVTAMGDVVNTAARLQTAAEPGQILVGASTHAATRDAIAYEQLGARSVKGREDPVDMWRALAPTAAPGQRRRRRDLPLIGRDDEFALLQRAVRTSFRQQRALLVLLAADVGVGKSRLADEVARWAADELGALAREGRCLPYGEANVWWPVAEVMRSGIGIPADLNVDDTMAVIHGHLRKLFPPTVADAEIDRIRQGLLTVLGFEPPANVDPVTAREEAARSLVLYAGALGAVAPLVLQISDLHFADDALLRLIEDVTANVHNRPVVVLATARPNLLDRWQPASGRHNALVLHLDPLNREASAELLTELTGRAVPDDLADALLTRSGGNPFFLEELVSLVDVSTTDTGSIRIVGDGAAAEPVLGDADGSALGFGGAGRALPATLRGLVAARLDDLDSQARSVLQDAAVIGRRGPLGGLIHLVRSAHPDNEIDAVSAVHRLVDEDLLELEDDTWSFRSDVVRDVAYQTLTKLDRARSHLGIATFLEHIHDQTTPTPTWLVDQLAFHYDAAATLAGDLGSVATSTPLPSDTVARARRWVLAAAQRSERDGTMATAVRRYRHAVELATEDGASDEELADLEIRLAEAAVENWDAETALAAVTAAETLVPDARSRVHAASAVVRGQVEQRRGAIDAAVDHLAIAAHRFERLGDLPAAANAKRLRALAEIFGGRLDAGRRSAQAAFDGFEDLGDVLGQAWALQHLAWIAFVRGDAAEADGHLNGAIERFSDVGDTRGLAWSLGLAAWVRFQTRRVQEASILAHLVLEEARARRDSWAIAMMTMLEAATALWSGRTDEAVALAQESERGFRALGNQYGLDQSRAIVGRSLVMAGRVDEGFRVLDEEPPIELPADELAEWLARPLTRLATAAQVGEVERAGGEPALVDAAQRWAGVTSPVLGLLLLQGGRVDEAEAPLDLPAADVLAADDLADRLAGTDPSLTSVQALWFSVAHRDGAVALADAVADSAEATYLDRTLADLAAAARRAALGDADGADRHLLRALRAVAGTEDRVAPAIVALANAAVATALRRPDAEDLTARADQALGEMGLRAEGWRRLFAAAAATGT